VSVDLLFYAVRWGVGEAVRCAPWRIRQFLDCCHIYRRLAIVGPAGDISLVTDFPLSSINATGLAVKYSLTVASTPTRVVTRAGDARNVERIFHGGGSHVPNECWPRLRAVVTLGFLCRIREAGVRRQPVTAYEGGAGVDR